jgi:hypothetical protein
MTISSSEGKEPKSWIDLINESVHTADDIDIGDIIAVSRDFVVVKRGFVNIHYYYIPINRVEGWDGNVLWLKINESEAKGNYERNNIPDSHRYYIKDYPYYSTTHYPLLTMIPSRYTKPDYPTSIPPDSEVPRMYKCDLCNSVFDNEEKLSNHISIAAH